MASTRLGVSGIPRPPQSFSAHAASPEVAAQITRLGMYGGPRPVQSFSAHTASIPSIDGGGIIRRRRRRQRGSR